MSVLAGVISASSVDHHRHVRCHDRAVLFRPFHKGYSGGLREWPSGWRVCCTRMRAQILILSSLGTFKEVGEILVHRSTTVYPGTFELLHMSRVHRCLHLVGPQWYDRSDYKDLGHVNSTSASTETRSWNVKGWATPWEQRGLYKLWKHLHVV